MEKSAQSLAGAGRCYQKLGKPGLAIYYLKQALDLKPAASEEQVILADLGYLYNSVEEYASAADAWDRCLRLEKNASISLQLARVRRLMGEYTAAEEALKDAVSDRLSKQGNIELLDERAALLAHSGNLKASTEALLEADRLGPAAWREYEIGLRSKNEKRWPEAIAWFRSAVDKDPEQQVYLQALAYTLEAAGELREADRVFQVLSSRYPGDVRWYKSLGYVNMRLARNKEAAAWFRQAISHSSANQNDADAMRDNYLMRSEVNRLTTHHEVTLYHGYVSNGYTHNGAFDLFGISPFPSPTGIEAAYQPPGIGLRNGRIFQVFGRLLWNSDSNSLRFDNRYYEAGFGIRYKPLARQNLWLSTERLMHSGTVIPEKWLVRGLYSWNPGYEVKPSRRSWNYTLMYSDSALVLGGNSFFAQYGEIRRGRTINLGNNLLLTPHVVADARRQTATGLFGSYIEGGAGVSMRFLYNQTAYETQRSSVELVVQCKRGNLLSQGPQAAPTVGYGGCTAMGIVRF
jgi:adsorption protein A